MPSTKSKAKKRSRPRVSIIGSGRLGTALALALSSAGYQIQALVARRLSRARRAATLLGKPVFALAGDQLHQLPASELVLITTPDDRIATVARDLANLKERPEHSTTVLHTSGALSVEVLRPLSEIGYHVGSMHPLVSISDARAGAVQLRGAFYCVEGGRVAGEIARSVVSYLEGQSFSIASQNKALYHAAAVVASGHLVALLDVAVEMLVSSGLTERRARRILMPLVESTVKNLFVSSSADALTGTFARADIATAQKHVRALEAASEDALAVYGVLGRRSLALAKKKGADPEALKKISKILERAGGNSS